MQEPPPIPELLKQLAAMAANVASLAGQRDLDWSRQPSEDEWSLAEVMCHLRDVEREVHQVRFRLLIAEDNVFLTGVSADEWADERGYCFEDGRKAMRSFLNAREETIALLEPLGADTWKRQGRHAFFGQTSMHELLYIVVRHDQIHWQQITELLAPTEGG